MTRVAFFNLPCVFFCFSDVHMYMAQPAVYGPNPGNMVPGDVPPYQNPSSVPAGMGPPPSYAQSLQAPSDGQQAPYPADKALL